MRRAGSFFGGQRGQGVFEDAGQCAAERQVVASLISEFGRRMAIRSRQFLHVEFQPLAAIGGEFFGQLGLICVDRGIVGEDRGAEQIDPQSPQRVAGVQGERRRAMSLGVGEFSQRQQRLAQAIVDCDRSRMQRRSPREQVGGGRELPQFRAGRGEIAQGFEPCGSDVQGPLIAANGRFDPTQLLQRGAKIVEQRIAVGGQGQRPLIASAGSLVIAHPRVQGRQTFVGFEAPRLDRDRSLVVGDRREPIAAPLEGLRQGKPRRGPIRPRRDHLPERRQFIRRRRGAWRRIDGEKRRRTGGETVHEAKEPVRL